MDALPCASASLHGPPPPPTWSEVSTQSSAPPAHSDERLARAPFRFSESEVALTLHLRVPHPVYPDEGRERFLRRVGSFLAETPNFICSLCCAPAPESRPACSSRPASAAVALADVGLSDLHPILLIVVIPSSVARRPGEVSVSSLGGD